MSNEFIEEYFVRIGLDSKKMLPDLKKVLGKAEKILEKYNAKEVKAQKAKQAQIKRTTQVKQQAYKREDALQNKQLADMKKFYKQQEKRASAAHNITENLKTQVKYTKLNTRQQEQLNRKLKDASRTLRETGNRDLFSEARRDLTAMARQSDTLARNMKDASRQRLQARNDLKQQGAQVARAGVVAGAAGAIATTLSTKRLVEIGKQQDKLLSSLEVVYGTQAATKLSDLQTFIAKSGGSLESSAETIANAIPVLDKSMGANAIPFFKNLSRINTANNISGDDGAQILKQVLQYQDNKEGGVTREDISPITERLPLFANFLNDYLKEGYGKNIKAMTAAGELTAGMVNDSLEQYARSKQVNELYLKAQNGMMKKSADLENAVYLRWVEVSKENGDDLKDAMKSLTDAVNSEEGKQAFKGFARLLGGIYETSSDLIKFTGSMSDESTNLVDTFKQLDSTASKVVVGLAGIYAGKKAVDTATWFAKAFRNLKAANMNVAAANVTVVGKGKGGLGGGVDTDKATKTGKAGKLDKLSKLAKSGAGTAAMGGLYGLAGWQLNNIYQEKGAVRAGAHILPVPGGQLVANGALDLFDNFKSHFEGSARSVPASNTTNSTNNFTVNVTAHGNELGASDIADKVRQELYNFTATTGGR